MRVTIQPAFDLHAPETMQSKPEKSFGAVHGATAVSHLNFMQKQFAILLIVSGLALCAANITQAAVTVTAATGGNNISADKALNSTNGAAFTALGNIVITEGAASDFGAGANQTLILTLPSGWRFNAGVGTVSFTSSRNVTAATISVTASNATV